MASRQPPLGTTEEGERMRGGEKEKEKVARKKVAKKQGKREGEVRSSEEEASINHF